MRLPAPKELSNKKILGKLSLSRETLRLLDNAGLKWAGGVRAVEPPDYTSDITNCYICPVYPVTTENA